MSISDKLPSSRRSCRADRVFVDADPERAEGAGWPAAAKPMPQEVSLSIRSSYRSVPRLQYLPVHRFICFSIKCCEIHI